MKVLCDHQTGYLPWLGLFHRISLCDVYVSLDTVKYKKSSWDDRNKIKTPDSFKWLKVPTFKYGSELLKDIKINHEIAWVNEHLKAIKYSYSGTKFFNYYYSKIKEILEKKHTFLMELNEELLKFFLKELQINVAFYKASNFSISGKGNEYLINLCKAFNADVYVFGQMGKNYAIPELWKENNIIIYHHSFRHPVYNQKFGEFRPYMAVIDLLFNEGGSKGKEILMKNNISRETMLKELQIVNS